MTEGVNGTSATSRSMVDRCGRVCQYLIHGNSQTRTRVVAVEKWRSGDVAQVFILLSLGFAAAGCGSSRPIAGGVDVSRQNLQKIGAAYVKATTQLKRPPEKSDDLLPFLTSDTRPGDPLSVLRSPNDGENYVIVWGVDVRKLVMNRNKTRVIIAYEKWGKEGVRYVLKAPNHVVALSEEQFTKASFPPGHRPAW